MLFPFALLWQRIKGVVDMLVLSRKVGEEIVMPTCRLTMTVLNVAGERVKFGISAPPSVAVHRKEIWQRIQEEKNITTEELSMSIHVLIADPNEYLSDSYSNYLSQHGFKVDTASNGLECVEKLREFMPDILVLEPMMPWGGGDGVLALMHNDLDMAIIPIMILTYGCDPSVLYNISPYSISDFQIKPMSPRRLAERIAKIIANKETMAECAKGKEMIGVSGASRR
jgi:carbon storage regulator CsrA